MIRNSQAKAIIEQVYQTIANIILTFCHVVSIWARFNFERSTRRQQEADSGTQAAADQTKLFKRKWKTHSISIQARRASADHVRSTSKMCQHSI